MRVEVTKETYKATTTIKTMASSDTHVINNLIM